MKEETYSDECCPLKSKVMCGNCGCAMVYTENPDGGGCFRCNHSIRNENNVDCCGEGILEELLCIRVFAQLKQWMLMLEAVSESVDETQNPELVSLTERAALFENEDHLTCEMADIFVEAVTVYDTDRIEITWKWKDLLEAALKEAA